MPAIPGLEACRRIKKTTPGTKVIITTAADDVLIREEAIKVGASAFVIKNCVVDDLVPAIHKAFIGDPDVCDD